MPLPLPPKARPVRPRHDASVASPYYGYGYDPSRPSIVIVAHDEAAGDRLYVYADRACALVGPPAALPLVVHDGDAPLAVLTAELVLPSKLRVTLSGAVPRGAAWRWAGGPSAFRDARGGAYPNPAAGTCFDAPGPYAPPPPATVTGAFADGAFACYLTFDAPVYLAPGAPPDDAVTLGGAAPLAVSPWDPYRVRFDTPIAIQPGDPWVIARQPAWLLTPVAWPADGTF